MSDLSNYGELFKTGTVSCRTDQWNHPAFRDMPFADNDDVCAICGRPVSTIRLGPDTDCLYTRLALPHQRPMEWYVVRRDVIQGLLDDLEWC